MHIRFGAGPQIGGTAFLQRAADVQSNAIRARLRINSQVNLTFMEGITLQKSLITRAPPCVCVLRCCCDVLGVRVLTAWWLAQLAQERPNG